LTKRSNKKGNSAISLSLGNTSSTGIIASRGNMDATDTLEQYKLVLSQTEQSSRQGNAKQLSECKPETTSFTIASLAQSASLEQDEHNGDRRDAVMKIFQCRFCSQFAARNLKETQKHEKNCKKKGTFFCNICSKPYASMRSVRRHKKHAHSSSASLLQCLVCQKVFFHQEQLNHHQKTVMKCRAMHIYDKLICQVKK